MKFNEKNIEMILLLLIIVIATCTYRFGYLEYRDKTAEVEKESQQLKVKIANLQTRIARRSEVEGGLTDAELRIREVLDKYGPGNSVEKSLMIISMLEDNVDVRIRSVGFGSDSCFFKSNELRDDGSPRVSAYKTTLSISYETDYQGLKDMMDYINGYPERMNVDNFNAVYNPDNDGVTGSMVLNLYSVETEGYEYEEPLIEDIELGKENIFD